MFIQVTNLHGRNLLICEILPIAFLELRIELDKLVESSAAEREKDSNVYTSINNLTQIIPFTSLTFSDRQICTPKRATGDTHKNMPGLRDAFSVSAHDGRNCIDFCRVVPQIKRLCADDGITHSLARVRRHDSNQQWWTRISQSNEFVKSKHQEARRARRV